MPLNDSPAPIGSTIGTGVAPSWLFIWSMTA